MSTETPHGHLHRYHLATAVIFRCHDRLQPNRERVIGGRRTSVEAGIGSGLNLAFFRPAVREVLALGLAAKLLAMAPARARSGNARQLHRGICRIHLPRRLERRHSRDPPGPCARSRAVAAIAEMRRVLKPAGKLLFVEHGLAPDAGMRWWQDRLTPIWRRIGWRPATWRARSR